MLDIVADYSEYRNMCKVSDTTSLTRSDDASSKNAVRKRVSFSDEDQVIMLQRPDPSLLADLFYTAADYRRFRAEYVQEQLMTDNQRQQKTKYASYSSPRKPQRRRSMQRRQPPKIETDSSTVGRRLPPRRLPPRQKTVPPSGGRWSSGVSDKGATAVPRKCCVQRSPLSCHSLH
ncbi:expressed unknown protein [Seminavis robusta]|uniref:Uncharacterized protein n=1 Tax=Seminavis robusta TaxID=568900 RepID=A0A9N8DWR6_9STRA|nr:expressed unknown protein [Seminavis robusta]|eukprot:Sro420_g139251.1  (175) ;mRNA; r:14533-15057